MCVYVCVCQYVCIYTIYVCVCTIPTPIFPLDAYRPMLFKENIGYPLASRPQQLASTLPSLDVHIATVGSAIGILY